MQSTLPEALKRFYDYYDPDHGFSDDYFNKVAEKYKGSEAEVFKKLYDYYDPDHGYGEDYFQQLGVKFGGGKKKESAVQTTPQSPIQTAPQTPIQTTPQGSIQTTPQGSGQITGVPQEGEDLIALADKYGYGRLNIEELTDEAVNLIQSGDAGSITAFESGFDQVVSSAMTAIEAAKQSAERIDLGGTFTPGGMGAGLATTITQKDEEEYRKRRQKIADLDRLQASGYFERGGLYERAVLQSLVGSKKMQAALAARGLDPEKTLADALRGDAKGFWRRLSMAVAQQGAQLLGQIGVGMAGGVIGGPAGGLTASAAFMSSQAGGGRLLEGLVEDQKITDEDKVAALGSAILEFTAERIGGPVGRLGGKIGSFLVRKGVDVAEEVIKKGGLNKLIDFVKAFVKGGGQETIEETTVTALTPINEAIAKELTKEDPKYDVEEFFREQYGDGFTDRMLESGLTAFATGGAAGGIGRALRRTKDAATPESLGGVQIPEELTEDVKGDTQIQQAVNAILAQAPDYLPEDYTEEDVLELVDAYISEVESENEQVEIGAKRTKIKDALMVVLPEFMQQQPPTEQPPTEQPPTEQPPTEQPPTEQPPVQTEGQIELDFEQPQPQPEAQPETGLAPVETGVVPSGPPAEIPVETGVVPAETGVVPSGPPAEIPVETPIEAGELGPETPVVALPERRRGLGRKLTDEDLEALDIEDIEYEDVEVTPEEIEEGTDAIILDDVPEEQMPQPGEVGSVAIEDLTVDPDRFQYKDVADKEAGVGEKLRGEGIKFDPVLAGVISVWVDPADGKTYVVNGHHRFDLAKRSGTKNINVIYIDAKNESDARYIGAIQNISEGQGTDIDAAKIFREKGFTSAEQIQGTNLSLTSSKVKNGLALANLSDGLFNLVVQEKLKPSIGIIIGETIQDKNVQEQFYKAIANKNLNNATIKIMAEDIATAPKETITQTDLFGGTEVVIADYETKAKFLAAIRTIISKAKNLLGKTAKASEFLQQYGNDINVAATESGSRESAIALTVFDKLRNTSKGISAIIDEGLERIRKGENKKDVINETAKRIIDETPDILEREGFPPPKTGSPVVQERDGGTQDVEGGQIPEQPTERPEQTLAVTEDGDTTVIDLTEVGDVVDGEFKWKEAARLAIDRLIKGLNLSQRSDFAELPKILQAFGNYVKGRKILVHKDDKALRDYLNKQKVSYDVPPRTNAFVIGNEIHFVADRTKGDTTKHEFLHVFFGELLKYNEQAANDLHNKLMSIPEYKKIYNQIRNNTAYQAIYQADESKYIDEAFATYLGEAASGKMPKGALKQLIEYINEVLKSVGINYQIGLKDLDPQKFADGLISHIRAGVPIPAIDITDLSPFDISDKVVASEKLMEGFAAISDENKAIVDDLIRKGKDENPLKEGVDSLLGLVYFMNQLETNDNPDLSLLSYLADQARKRRGVTNSIMGSIADIIMAYADQYGQPKFQLEVVDPFGPRANTKQEAVANFNKWRGTNRYVTGTAVQEIKTGEPVVAKAYHGTIRRFYEFKDTGETTETFLGNTVSYFTTSKQDANDNYTSGGADLNGKISLFLEKAESDLEVMNDDEFFKTYGSTKEEVIETQTIKNNPFNTEEDIVLDVFVKLDNPVVIGNGDFISNLDPIDPNIIEEAEQEIADMYDISVEEAREDYDDEIQDMIRETDIRESNILQAYNKAVRDFSNGEVRTFELDEIYYEDDLNADSVFEAILQAALYSTDPETGQVNNGVIIAETFRNLGYDGIIVNDVSNRFRGMNLSPNDSHIHIFNDQIGKIKLADGGNVEFDEANNDIRFQFESYIESNYDLGESKIKVGLDEISYDADRAIGRRQAKSNPATYKSLAKFAKGRVLDYGAADGEGAASLVEQGIDVLAYEPNLLGVTSQIPIDYTNAFTIREKFDTVFAVNLEGLDKYATEVAITDVFNKLKIGGKAYFAATNLPSILASMPNGVKVTKKGALVELERTSLSNVPRFSITGARGLEREIRTTSGQDLMVAKEDKRQLRLAQAMRSMGLPPMRILEMTGWQMTRLGHWSKVVTKDGLDVLKAAQVFIDTTLNWKGKKVKLSSLYPNNESNRLFRQYPELKGFNVSFSLNMAGNTFASVWYEQKSIKINVKAGLAKYANLKSDPFLFMEKLGGFLVNNFEHEIQHIIQDIEGWYRGGSETSIARMRKSFKKGELDLPISDYLGLTNAIDEYNHIIKQIKTIPKNRSNEAGFKERLKVLKQEKADSVERIKSIKIDVLKKYGTNIGKFRSFFEYKQKVAGKPFSDYRVYRLMAGEVEARMSEFLATLSPDERAMALIDDFYDKVDVINPDDIFNLFGYAYKGLMKERYTEGNVRPGGIATVSDGFSTKMETDLLIALSDALSKYTATPTLMLEGAKLAARYIDDDSVINKSEYARFLMSYDIDNDRDLAASIRLANKRSVGTSQVTEATEAVKPEPDKISLKKLKTKYKASSTGAITQDRARQVFELFTQTGIEILNAGQKTPMFQIGQDVKDLDKDSKLRAFDSIGIADTRKLGILPEKTYRKFISETINDIEELSFESIIQLNERMRQTTPEVRTELNGKIHDAINNAVIALKEDNDVRSLQVMGDIKSLMAEKIDSFHYRSLLESLSAGNPTNIALRRFIIGSMDYLAAPIRNEQTPMFQLGGVRQGHRFKPAQPKSSRQRVLENLIKTRDKDPQYRDDEIIETILNAYPEYDFDFAKNLLEETLKRKYIPHVSNLRKEIVKNIHRAKSKFSGNSIRNGIVRGWRELQLNLIDSNAAVRTFEEEMAENDAEMEAFVMALQESGMDFTDIDAAIEKLYAEQGKKIKKYRKQILKSKKIIEDGPWAQASTKLTKAAYYEEVLMQKLYGGDINNPRFKTRRAKSLLGKAEKLGITYDEINDFLFFRHIPEFLDRKNDYIRQEREKVMNEIGELYMELEQTRDALAGLQGMIEEGDLEGKELRQKKQAAATLERDMYALEKKIEEKEDALENEDYLQFVNSLGKYYVGKKGFDITKDFANSKVAELQKKHKKIEETAEEIRNFLNKENIRILEENKLIDPKRIKHLRDGTSDRSEVEFKYYVPFIVKDDVAKDSNFAPATFFTDNTGVDGLYNLGAGGREYGRGDRYDPISMMSLLAAANNKFALENEVRREFADIVQKNAINAFAIKKGRGGRIPVAGEGNPEIHQEQKEMIADTDKYVKEDEMVMFIGRDGKEYRISPLTNEAKASYVYRALQRNKGLNTNLLVKAFTFMNNYGRDLITSLNLFFGVTQVVPDALDGGINAAIDIGAITGESKAKIGKVYAKNYAKSVKFFLGDGINSVLGKEGENELARAYQEFYKYGGRMSWRKLGGERLKAYNMLQKEIDAAEKGQPMTKAAVKKLFQTISNINDGMENFARFASYLTAKEMGLSLTESAAIARESTVDFGARGKSQYYDVLKLMYLFFGPAAKGLDRTVRTMNKLGPKGWALAMLAPMLARALMYSLSEDDEELDRAINNQFTNRNRFMIPIPVNGKYPLSVKMPYSGLRFAHSLGIGVVDNFYGKRTKADIASDLMENLSVMIDPVSGGSGSIFSYTPTIIGKALVQTNLDVNRDYKGDPIISEYKILNENFKKDMYNKNTKVAYIRLSEILYDEFNIDKSPAMMEYFFEQTLLLPAITRPVETVSEWMYAMTGERVGTELLKPLYAEDLPERELDLNKLRGPLSSFYYESKNEISDMMYFFEVSENKNATRGLTEEQYNYLIRTSEMMWEEELVKWATIKKALDKMSTKFPTTSKGKELDWEYQIRYLQKRNTRRNAIRKGNR